MGLSAAHCPPTECAPDACCVDHWVGGYSIGHITYVESTVGNKQVAGRRHIHAWLIIAGRERGPAGRDGTGYQ